MVSLFFCIDFAFADIVFEPTQACSSGGCSAYIGGCNPGSHYYSIGTEIAVIWCDGGAYFYTDDNIWAEYPGIGGTFQTISAGMDNAVVVTEDGGGFGRAYSYDSTRGRLLESGFGDLYGGPYFISTGSRVAVVSDSNGNTVFYSGIKGRWSDSYSLGNVQDVGAGEGFAVVMSSYGGDLYESLYKASSDSLESFDTYLGPGLAQLDVAYDIIAYADTSGNYKVHTCNWDCLCDENNDGIFSEVIGSGGGDFKGLGAGRGFAMFVADGEGYSPSTIKVFDEDYGSYGGWTSREFPWTNNWEILGLDVGKHIAGVVVRDNNPDTADVYYLYDKNLDDKWFEDTPGEGNTLPSLNEKFVYDIEERYVLAGDDKVSFSSYGDGSYLVYGYDSDWEEFKFEEVSSFPRIGHLSYVSCFNNQGSIISSLNFGGYAFSDDPINPWGNAPYSDVLGRCDGYTCCALPDYVPEGSFDNWITSISPNIFEQGELTEGVNLLGGISSNLECGAEIASAVWEIPDPDDLQDRKYILDESVPPDNLVSDVSIPTSIANSYPIGEYDVVFSVRDSYGLRKTDSLGFEVRGETSGSEPPISRIVSVTPGQEIFKGDIVSLVGEGLDDGWISEVSWRDVEGSILSSDLIFDFDTSSLDVGGHAIEFRVKDNDGLEASSSVIIYVFDRPTASYSWERADLGIPLALRGVDVSEGVGYIIGDGGAFFKKEGGYHWQGEIAGTYNQDFSEWEDPSCPSGLCVPEGWSFTSAIYVDDRSVTNQDLELFTAEGGSAAYAFQSLAVYAGSEYTLSGRAFTEYKPAEQSDGFCSNDGDSIPLPCPCCYCFDNPEEECIFNMDGCFDAIGGDYPVDCFDDCSVEGCEGQPCGENMICDLGECILDCSGELSECNGECVDTDTDENNCGSCNIPCGSDEICLNGICLVSEDLECYGNCYLGDCEGEVCDVGGQICIDEYCSCPLGLTDCSGDCVDWMTDEDNCGECNFPCSMGYVCEQGDCVPIQDEEECPGEDACGYCMWEEGSSPEEYGEDWRVEVHGPGGLIAEAHGENLDWEEFELNFVANSPFVEIRLYPDVYYAPTEYLLNHYDDISLEISDASVLFHSPGEMDLSAVSSVSGEEAWVSGNSLVESPSKIYKTSDGGSTWEEKFTSGNPPGPDTWITDLDTFQREGQENIGVAFIANYVSAGADSAHLFFSESEFAEYPIHKETSSSGELFGLDCIDIDPNNSRCYASFDDSGFDPGIFAKYRYWGSGIWDWFSYFDGGQERPRLPIHDLEFTRHYEGWAVGKPRPSANPPISGVWMTGDGGETWHMKDIPYLHHNGKNLYAVNFLDRDRGVIVGEDGIILTTNDRGNHWNLESHCLYGTCPDLYDVFYVSDEEIYAVGQYGSLYSVTPNSPPQIIIDLVSGAETDPDVPPDFVTDKYVEEEQVNNLVIGSFVEDESENLEYKWEITNRAGGWNVISEDEQLDISPGYLINHHDIGPGIHWIRLKVSDDAEIPLEGVSDSVAIRFKPAVPIAPPEPVMEVVLNPSVEVVQESCDESDYSCFNGCQVFEYSGEGSDPEDGGWIEGHSWMMKELEEGEEILVGDSSSGTFSGKQLVPGGWTDSFLNYNLLYEVQDDDELWSDSAVGGFRLVNSNLPNYGEFCTEYCCGEGEECYNPDYYSSPSGIWAGENVKDYGGGFDFRRGCCGDDLGEYFKIGSEGVAKCCDASHYTVITSNGCYYEGGGSCFLAGTKILMADGSEKKIEDVQVGDFVIGKDGKSEVYELESPIREGYYLITFEDGSELKVTNEHPIYARKGKIKGWSSIIPEATWEDAKMDVDKLTEESEVLTIDGWRDIEKIEYFEGKIQTYNLKSVEGSTFYAGGVLVHNKPPHMAVDFIGGEEPGDEGNPPEDENESEIPLNESSLNETIVKISDKEKPKFSPRSIWERIFDILF